MSYRAATRRERLVGASGALVVVLGLGAALLGGLVVQQPGTRVQKALETFNVAPPDPPPPQPDTEPPRERTKREEGASAPPNVTTRATEVQAPPPVLKPDPPPIPVATKAASGSDSTSGNADVPGPGTGAGGEGEGTGSGRSGNGSGGGGANSPPHRIGGRLSIADLPVDVIATARQGELTVGVIYRVLPNGSVGDCQIERPSGNRAIDAITCRLIEQRFRYEPSRTPSGRPVGSYIAENHSWIIRDLPRQPRR
ncbi:energy transducer TonB [Stakelama pacifica]|uniref:Protein TonB n=1 Tax=Stakelama pacifica TaxID=517720 RepID=A0A4R6FLX2_9SPHN|nr:energy transducer TonB [Stakelama pacifica]TDN81634.1 protein TonB [Stakelama pacifica]GGO96110.1 hypothetical protein GCM10011329_21860 [Stakelama pacifica]